MKKLFKWITYLVGLTILLLAGILAAAYWNRDNLLTRVTTALNKDINGDISIKEIDFTFLHDFPNFSITLRQVVLRENYDDRLQKDIVRAERVVLNVELLPLVQKEIVIRSMSIEDAAVFIIKNQKGDHNIDILKKSTEEPKSPGRPALLNLKRVNLRNVALAYADPSKNKFLNFRFLDARQSIDPTVSGYNMNIHGKMYFDSLYFNEKSKSFLADKYVDVTLNLHFGPNKLLTIQPSDVTYKKNKVRLAGSFELKQGGTYHLQFISDHIDPAEGEELLNKKLRQTLHKFKIEKPIRIDVKLTGKSTPGYIPFVDVAFETEDITLHYGPLDFTSLTAKGLFTNHIDSLKPRDNDNSKLTILSFDGRMEKMPLKGKAVFTALQDPVVSLSFTSRLTFKDVNRHLDANRFNLTKGIFTTDVSYHGKLSEYLDPSRTRYEGKLRGRVQATDASLSYKPKKISLEKVFLKCTFNEKVFTIDDLILQANGSKVKFQGRVENFIPFFIQPKNKGYVKLSAYSPDFDLTTFTSKRETGKNYQDKKSENRKKITELLDRVYEKLEFDVSVNVDRLTFRKFSATNFKGQINLENNALRANPISMRLAEGSMDLNFSLHDIFNSTSPMRIEAKLVNADIKNLFENFNDFNQKTIAAKNLEGKISADVKFSATLDDRFALVASTMRGTLDCKITEGRLKDFEPMENMSNFLLKKRDFSDVQFAELNSAFSVEGTNMDISRMEIQSTVLSLFLEGRYSFTDSTSLSVQIPLSNLKKRHKDFKPKNIGIHTKAGPSIFLHVYRDRDINSKIKIDYDPFKKWAVN